MPQSLAQLYTHLVFSTKRRQPYLRDAQLRDNLHAYLAGACRNLGSPSLTVGGVEDHVHVPCRLSKTMNVAELIRELKRESSKWLKGVSPGLRMFQWQSGCGAFSISPSHVPALMRYISNQAAHHHTESFQDEFRRLCRKFGLESTNDMCGFDRPGVCLSNPFGVSTPVVARFPGCAAERGDPGLWRRTPGAVRGR